MKQLMVLLTMLGAVTAAWGEWVNVTYQQPWTPGYVNEGANTGEFAYEAVKPVSGDWTVSYDLRSQMNPIRIWSANQIGFFEWSTGTNNAGGSSSVVIKLNLSETATSASWNIEGAEVNISSGGTLVAAYSTNGVDFTPVYTYPAVYDYVIPGLKTFSFPPTKALYLGWFASVPSGEYAWYSIWSTGNITLTPAVGTPWEWSDAMFQYPWLPANVNGGSNTGGYAHSSTRPESGDWTVNLNLRTQIEQQNVWSAHSIKFCEWNVVPKSDYHDSSVIYKIDLSEAATSATWDISGHYVDLAMGNTLEAKYSTDGINFSTVYSYPVLTDNFDPAPQTFSFPPTTVLYIGWFGTSPTGLKAWYNPSETGPITLTPAAPSLGGDANGDGTVNFSDYLNFSAGFGTVGTPGTLWAQGDFNGDGVVNFSDYLILSQNYGTGGSVSAEEVAKFQAASAELTSDEPSEVVRQTLPCTPLAMALMAVIGLALYGLGSSFQSER